MHYKQISERTVWNDAVRDLPGASILQTWEWGNVKSEFGWQPYYLLWEDDSGKPLAAALVLIRPLMLSALKTAYVPQGPLLDWSNVSLYQNVLQGLKEFTRRMGAFSLKIDPEVIHAIGTETTINSAQRETADAVVEYLMDIGFLYSSQQVQFKNTAWLRLNGSEDDLLARMKQKTRYNIRLASRKDVSIRRGTSADIPMLYQMYLETSIRDGFIIRPREYYQRVWDAFMDAGMAVPLIAEAEHESMAGLMLFHFGSRSWYLYGMSSNAHRERMPNYLLQWEAIRLSRELGCEIYDMWGAPDQFDPSDRMWGVYRFKEGLGAEPVQRIGAYDLPLKKFAYRIFIILIPRLLSIMRRVRRGQQQQELN